MEKIRSMVEDILLKLMVEDSKHSEKLSKLSDLGIGVDENGGAFETLKRMVGNFEYTYEACEEILENGEFAKEHLELLIDCVMENYGFDSKKATISYQPATLRRG